MFFLRSTVQPLTCALALPLVLSLVLPAAAHAQAVAASAPTTPAAPAKAASKPKYDATPIDLDPKDPATKKAFRRAQATLDKFLAVAAEKNPKYSSIAMRVAVHQGKRTEYIWITPFTVIDRNTFSGQVNNIPMVVSNVQVGQEWHFKRADVVDWMYFDAAGKQMFGNFTTCALLTKASAAEQDEMKKRYGLDCSR